MRYRIFGVIAVVTIFALSLRAGETVTGYESETPEKYKVSNNVAAELPLSLVSPHIKWATPFALGKLNCLVLLPAEAARDAVELKERIDCELTPLLTFRHIDEVEKEQYILGPLYKNLADDASIKLSRAYHYDVIVIGRLHWPVLSAEMKKMIFEKVKAGSGLVLIGTWDVDEESLKQIAWDETRDLQEKINRQIPLQALGLERALELPDNGYQPRDIGPTEIREGRCGGGKVIVLDYHDDKLKNGDNVFLKGGAWKYHGLREIGLTPYLKDDPVFYDYYYSILAKVMIAAAGKNTGVSLAPPQNEFTVDRAEGNGSPVEFTCSAAFENPQELTLSYEVRDRSNAVVASGRQNLTIGKEPVMFKPVIKLPRRGMYLVDVWVKDNGRVLDWASASLMVTSSTFIKGVAFDKETFNRSEKICGQAMLENFREGDNLSLELWDTYGRLLQKAENMAVAEGVARFEFMKIEYPLSRTFKVVTTLQDDVGVIDRNETWAAMPDSEVDDFQFIMWAGASDTRLNKVIMRQCLDYGVSGYYETDTCWSPENVYRHSADTLARNNLLAWPYAYGIWGFAITDSAPFDKTYEAYRNKAYQPKARAYARYGVAAYSICEENFIARDPEKWNNKTALRDYQEYLQEKYKTIGELNAIWKSEFATFEEIGVIEFSTAKRDGQFTRWLEQNLHKIDRFNKIHEASAEAVLEVDPNARLSFDCVHGMDFDWPRMNKILRAYTQCPLEDFSKDRGDLVGTWIGNYHNANDEYTMRTVPWRVLFRGGSHIMWWPVNGAFTPDYSQPLLCLQQSAQELREIRSGAGKLLMSSRKRLDPIYILWSNASYHAGIINPRGMPWQRAQDSFKNLFRHTGLDFQMIDPESLCKEFRFDEKHRVLVLPETQAISPETAKVIENFACEGGVVIADSIPGIMDDYLRPYGGMEKTETDGEEIVCPQCKGKMRVEIGNTWQPCPKCGGTGKLIESGNKVVEKSILVELFDFSRQGARKYGKGLGFFLPDGGEKKETWTAIRRLLVETGAVRDDLSFLDSLGAYRIDAESYVLDNGRARIMGLIPPQTIKAPPGNDSCLRLDAPMHLYNLRLRKYVGQGTEFKIALVPDQPQLFALLPERIERVTLSADQKAAKPGECVKLRGNIFPESLKDSNFVVRFSVRGSSGSLPEFTRNIAFNGEFETTLPLASNQKPGEYTATAVDVVSGYVAEAVFAVEK
jgi:hypothetical protein